jgi:hypothetical protein
MFQETRVSPIEPGRQYRQRACGAVISTARVLSIQPDLRGIPHVLYEVSLELRSGTATREGNRLLALDSFAALFPVAI